MFYLVHTDFKCLLEVTLAWFNCALDWIIFHPDPVFLLPVLIILRRPNPNAMCMCHRKGLKYLTTKIWFPSSLQVSSKFLPIILMFLMVLDAVLVPHTIFRWILVSHQSKQPVNQFLFIQKKLSRRRLTRCYKWEFWSLWTKQLLGSTVLC